MKRKAQSASDISTLVLIIGLFLLLYIILVPPETRDELLNQSSSTQGAEVQASKVLLSVSPGKVYPYTTNLMEIKLEPIQLFKRFSLETIPLVDSLIISHSLLHNGEKTIIFNIDDITKVNSLKLLAMITDQSGILTIKLNDAIVYNGNLKNNDFPLRLSTASLKKGENRLTLSVSKPTTKFYETNQYSFKNLKLILSTKKEHLSDKKTFYLDEEADRIALSYSIVCNQNKDSMLKIKLNGKTISSSLVYCNAPSERKLYLSDVKKGKNDLEFILDEGDISLKDAKISSALNKASYPSFVFDIDSETFSKISTGKKLKLYLKFADTDRKETNVKVQSTQFLIDTNRDVYEYDISQLIDRGSNIITLEPINSFNIVNLKVYLEA